MEEFDESSLKSKIYNMLVQLLIAITKEDLSDVLHFLKDQPREYAENIINDLKAKKTHQKYDELNISHITVGLVEDKENILYNAVVNTKSLDYKVNDNGNIVEGNNDHRVEKTYYLKIIKNKHTKEESIILRCPGCGHSLDVNYSGKCPYCGAIFNQEDYDYQILEIK